MSKHTISISRLNRGPNAVNGYGCPVAVCKLQIKPADRSHEFEAIVYANGLLIVSITMFAGRHIYTVQRSGWEARLELSKALDGIWHQRATATVESNAAIQAQCKAHWAAHFANQQAVAA